MPGYDDRLGLDEVDFPARAAEEIRESLPGRGHVSINRTIPVRLDDRLVGVIVGAPGILDGPLRVPAG